MNVIFEYPFRRCGSYEHGTSAANSAAKHIMESVAAGLKCSDQPPKVVVHRCHDGGSGLADLAGYGPPTE